jgi:hypothetical protein
MMNEYSMQMYAKHRLDEARTAAEAEALGRQAAAHARAEARQAGRHALARLGRALYARAARWSSAASSGSKPITARAWSRSR